MIDKNLPLPLYYQLKQEFIKRIELGEWKPGEQIPSERELCEIYQVSRMTIRQAVTELVYEGSLRRDQGRGTFVSKPKIKKYLSRLTGFTEDMKARGKRPGAKLLRSETVPAKPSIAKALQITEGQPVVLIERLRLADDETVGIECCHLSFKGCEAILQENLTGSLYELLASKFNQFPRKAEEQLEAAHSGAREARLLDIRRGDCIMLIKRITFNHEGYPFEYVESVYKSDRYVYYVKIER